MGEIKKSSAEKYRDRMVKNIKDCVKGLQKNFEDMDFENANARDDVEEYIDNMKKELNKKVTYLNGLSFE